MPKYRVVARTAYEEHSEPIEAQDPNEAMEKASVFFSADASFTEFVEVEELVEVYDDESEESPPPTWRRNSVGELKKWH